MDTVGRRGLLLTTFPLLAAFQFMMAGVTGWEATVTAMYMFCGFYSIGEGPVPFVSSHLNPESICAIRLTLSTLGLCFREYAFVSSGLWYGLVHWTSRSPFTLSLIANVSMSRYGNRYKCHVAVQLSASYIMAHI